MYILMASVAKKYNAQIFEFSGGHIMDILKEIHCMQAEFLCMINL